MRCRRPNGTFYGTAGKCRRGTQDESVGEDWREVNARKYPHLAEGVAKLDAALEKLPEKERDLFNEEIHKNFTDAKLIKHMSSGKPYTEEERAEALSKQVKGWVELVEMPRPSALVDRKGNPVEMPDKMTPFVTNTGTKGWIHGGIGNGRKFSPPKGKNKETNTWTQNRAGGEDTERAIPHMVSFREQRRREGKEWPARTLPPRTDISLDREEIIATIMSNQKLWKNGLNRTFNEGKRLLEFYGEHPEEVRRRAEDIADAYIRQGGRSGVTGNPIALPGADPRPGEEKSTIDHFNPISGGRKYTARELTQTLDNSSNFFLAEEGPNMMRRTTPWSEWLDKVSVKGVGKPKNGGQGTAAPASIPAARKTESVASPVTSRPPLSSKNKPTLDQQAQLRHAVKKFSKMLDMGLSSDEALAKLTPAQRDLYNQFETTLK